MLTGPSDNPLNERLIYPHPYVGVSILELPKEIGELGPEYGEESGKYELFAHLLIGLANQTTEFLTHFKNPYEYLKENSISRGSRDAILIERRGFVSAGLRSQPGYETPPGSIVAQFQNNPYRTLEFCIESIFATTKSVSSFNKELAAYVSEEINTMLDNIQGISRRKLRKMVGTISRARALSPCEDFSSNIIPCLKSRIAIETSKKVQDFALNQLIKVAHERLNNYGYFLRTVFDLQHAERISRLTLFIFCLTILVILVSLLTSCNSFTDMICSLLKNIYDSILRALGL